MFKSIINFYNSKKASERVLMMCTVYMLLIVWAFSIKNASADTTSAIEAKQIEIVKLEGVLSLEDKIMDSYAAVKRDLDESKMIDAQALQLCIEECALLSGIDYDISATSDSKLDNFQLFSITLNTKKVDLANLINFEMMLMNYAPYIRVNSATVSTSTKTIGASYKISSFIAK